jgi:thioredoxin-like negative regulator of GroEL
MKMLNDSSFDRALKEAQGTLVVKFSADWCVDCRRIEPAYKEFPTQFPAMEFAEIDTVESLQVSQRFDVRGIPSVLVFRNGELVDRLFSRDAKTARQVAEFVGRQAE